MREDDEQNENDDGNIRFKKHKWRIEMAQEDPYGCIAEVFTWIHLDDFRDELQEWFRVALINGESAYDEGPAREDVMDFCDELQLLMEALQVINMKPEDVRRWKEGLLDDLRKEIESYNQPMLLTEEQKADPSLVIRNFCNAFSLSYVRRELWDLLDSVIFYGRETSAWSPDPHITYRCLLALAEAAFALHQLS